MFKISRKLIVTVCLSLLVVACGSEPEVDVAGTVAASLSATQTAQPTETAVPPTQTTIPTDTPTWLPTETAVSTETPNPTETSVPPTLTPTPEPNIIETLLESGDTLYELPENGFSFILPPEWTVFDLEDGNLTKAIGAVGEQNDELSFLSTDYAQTLIASGMKFYALDISPTSLESGNPVSINVIVEELPFEMNASQYATLASGQIDQIFGLDGEIELLPITVGDVEGAKIVYIAQITNILGIPVEILTTQYIFIQNNKSYIISVGVITELADQYLELAETAAETFRFLNFVE